MIDSNIKRTLISIYIIFLLITAGFIGILVFEGVIDEGGVNAATTRYVGSGQTYTTINSALSAANNGDTIFVYNGTYIENLVISKRVSIIGECRDNTTIITNSLSMSIQITTSWVNVSNFTIRNTASNAGGVFRIQNSNHCMINNCYHKKTSSSNRHGVYLENSNDNKIVNNQFTGFIDFGIYLWNSKRNLIENNSVGNSSSDISQGIRMSRYSNSNIINNNSCYNNQYSGIETQSSSHGNLIFNNTCYLNDMNGIRSNTYSNHIYNNTCYSNKNSGIYCYYNNDISLKKIVNNNCYGNTKHGIEITNSKNLVVENNTCSGNGDCGIYIDSTTPVRLENNTCSNNNIGIRFLSSHKNTVINNTCNFNSGSTGHGIYFSGSSQNEISNNYIYNNSGYGIYINNGDSFNILYNRIFNNNNYCINLTSNSDNNVLHHNSFLNNNNDSVQTYDEGSNNQWDYLGEGNYWSDYQERYPFATNDGYIWDTPYDIHGSALAKDYYPLVAEGHMYILHGAIRINNNNEFNSSNGVIAGNGTKNNPYTIQGWNINGTGAGSCIYIGNTTKHFAVKDCQLHYASGNSKKYYWGSGLVLYNTTNGTIERNRCISNLDTTAGAGHGINLILSNNITLKNNNCTVNDENGIGIIFSLNNRLENNYCSKNTYGIHIAYSNYTTIKNNTCFSNKIGMFVRYSCFDWIDNNFCSNNRYQGIFPYISNNITITNNKCSDNLENGIYMDKVILSKIENNSCISNYDCGIGLQNSFNNRIVRNVCQQNEYGVGLDQSFNNTLVNNSVLDNDHGFYLKQSTNFFYSNKMVNCGFFIEKDFNTFTTQVIPINNTVNSKPVYYYKNIHMNNATVPLGAGQVIIGNVSWLRIENLMLNNLNIGFQSGYSNNLFIANNTCSNNIYGIHLTQSNRNILFRNILISNDYGIYISDTSSSNNLLHHNNFFYNNNGGIQAYDNGNNNHWNDTAGEGNYWDDYCYRYPMAKHDGHTWDIPYALGGSGGCSDLFPLVYRSLRPIRINGDSDFLSTNGVVTGNGSLENPYIIKDCSINGTGHGYSFYIGNTTKHFILKNCMLHNASGNAGENYWNSGLVLYNVTNGSIKNNIFKTNVGSGIYSNNSHYIYFINNIIVNNTVGINFSSGSDNCKIINTTKINSTTFDIRLNHDSHVLILNCRLNWSNFYYEDSNSNITVQWYLHINVKNEFNQFMSGAVVLVKDNISNIIFHGTTDGNGWCRWIICSEYVEDLNGITTILTPHNITISKKLYADTFAEPMPYMNMNTIQNIIIKRRPIIVDWQGQGDFTEIQSALYNTFNGDIIYVWSGTYNEDVTINNKIYLIGNGTGFTTIRGTGTREVVRITSDNVYISGFKITGSKRNTQGIGGININNFRKKCHIENNYCMGNSIGIYFAGNNEDNIVNNNSCSENDYNGIEIKNSKNNKIKYNICSNNKKYGIYLYSSSDNNIINNTVDSNDLHGIYLKNSNSNNIIINDGSYNDEHGICLESSTRNVIDGNFMIYNRNHQIFLKNANYNIIKYNYCKWKGLGWYYASGIYLENSKFNNIENNDCPINWLSIEFDQANSNFIRNNSIQSIWLDTSDWVIIDNNTCLSTRCDAIYIDNSDFCTVTNNNCTSTYEWGNAIDISSSSSMIIKNNQITKSRVGLSIDYCTSCVIQYNRIDNNRVSNIYIYRSNSNEINNNSLNSSSDSTGLWVIRSNANTIENNFCNSNQKYGINLSDSDSNTIKNNICNFNKVYGIDLFESNSNIIKHNIVNNNLNSGFLLKGSPSNIITNNTCSNNYYGFFILNSSSNNIFDNVISNTSKYGFLIENSISNIITNNSCSNNNYSFFILNSSSNNIFNNIISNNSKYGFLIENSISNIIANNSCSNNTYGFFILNSSSNNIFNNIISNNSKYGFSIDTSSNNNEIFYNHIIANAQQAIDNGNNFWNNSAQEGNYWSDYTGIDNGANGRILGDGIGDTLIPHLNLDNYPFTNRYGWIFPGIPILKDPGNVDSDGNYTISWNKTRGTLGYILEEDISNTFNSPTELYNGSDINFKLLNKPNGTYYYRLKAYNKYYESVWSNIVDIKVDWPPTAPTGLIAQDITGHEITLTWNPNPEQDVIGYHIYVNDTSSDSSGPYHRIHTLIGTSTTYTVTDLVEETTYYFIVVAYDAVPNNSTYSKWTTGTTLDVTPPQAPTGLKAVAMSASKINLTWIANVETDLMGYIIFLNDTNHGQIGSYHIVHIIFGTNTSYIVTGLSEEIKYYFKIKAFDEVPNNSSFSNIASATTQDETPPSAPIGLTVSNPTFNTFTLSWIANSESDVVGYILHRSLSLSGPYVLINSEPILEIQYLDTDLKEVTSYYYKIKAIDDAGLTSEFSDVAFGTTLLSPHPPEINNSVNDFEIYEDTIDVTSINLYYWFKDINNDMFKFRCEGNKNIFIEIFKNGTVRLEPKTNWNGIETLTFFANDSLFEIFDEVTITVLPVNDAPTNATIMLAEMKYYEGQYQPATGNAMDVDIPYGDELTFTWSSNISGLIGIGEEINLSLPTGFHIIILNVTDKEGAWCTVTTEIKILSSMSIEIDSDNDGYPNSIDVFPNDHTQWFDSDGDNYGDNPNGSNPDAYPYDPTKWKKEDEQHGNQEPGEKDSTWLIIGIIVIIIVIAIILIFLLIIERKKKEKIQIETYYEIGQRKQIQPPQSRQVIQQLQQSQLTQPYFCSICRQQLTFIRKYNRYYCYWCRRYE